MGQGTETDGNTTCNYRGGACTSCDDYCRYNVRRVKERKDVTGNADTAEHHNPHIQGS